MNKPAYLNFALIKITKKVMYVFWYGYMKPEFGKEPKLRYMDTAGFIVYIKQKIFIQRLQKMLKQNLIFQIMNQTNHYLEEKIKQ